MESEAKVLPVELVTVVTFNVLAPCYNAEEGGRHAATNLINSRQWQERHRAKVMRDTLAHQAADVICLQEYWFAPAFLSLYETEMARLGYQGVTLRRTGRKEDGVATFVCTERFDIVASHEVRFSDAGDRVALVVLLRSRKTGALFAVVNTHLTFPHREFDVRMRKQQTAKVLKAVELYLQKNELAIPVIVAGDFNGTNDDAVYAMMEGAGYVSSFKACNQREVGVTHRNHLDEDVGVDFIFVKNFSPEDIAKEVVQGETDTQECGFLSKKWVMEHRASIPSVTDAAGDAPQQRWALEVVQSWAHPAREPDTAWLDSFDDTSDHRPIVSRFKLLPAGETSQ